MKNKLFATLVALCISSLLTTALAVPAYPGWRTMEQPDGTTIELRLVGDEFYHYWINRDGQQVTKNEAGYWEVKAEQLSSNQVAQRRAESPRRKNAVAPRKAPALQPTKLLVILVNYSDKSMTSAHDNAFFNNMLNQTGFSPSGCVSEYFKASSEGHYIPQFDVFGPVTLDNNMAYYGANDDNGDDVRPAQMAVDACKKADDAGCNFANYDTDNDGVVDNVYIIYAGYGEASDTKGTMPNTIWPHSWDITSAGLSLTKDGKSIEHYACSAELRGNSGTQADGVGTFAHEFSHVIGMPDYYDTDYGTNYDNGVTPGDWSLMDGGSYNNDGQTPPLYSAYDKYFMGWATPRHPGTSAKSLILLPNGNDCYYSYQITSSSSLVSATNTSEQYYIEYRKKEGWDAYLPGEGMVVWKVKYNSTNWTKNNLNNTAGTLRYTIVPADGKTKDYGATDDPFPGTDNVTTWNGSTSGRNLKNITKSGNKVYVDYINRQSSLNVETLGDNATITGASTVTYNNNLALTVTPASGYRLDPESFDVTMGGACLVYGTDYTYSGTTLTINNVKGDVDVVVTGIVDVQYTVTWSVDGATTPVVYNAGAALVLPSTPSDCAGDGGKKFVGWTAIAGYSSATDAPSDMFTEAGTKTVTGNITYYAVYATESSSAPIRKAGTTSASVVFKKASSDSSTESTSDANIKSNIVDTYSGISTFSGSKSYAGKYGCKLGSSKASGSITMTLSTAITTKTISVNATKYGSDAGNIQVKVNGSTTFGSAQAPTASESTLTFTNSSDVAISSITVSTTSARGYIGSVSLSSGGGKTYTDYALNCGAVVPVDPECSFATTSKTLTFGESFTQTLTTNSNGAISYSSSNTGVATVDNSGVITTTGIGTTTIYGSTAATAKYNAGTNCAFYTITVNKVSPVVAFTSPTTSVQHGQSVTNTATVTPSGYTITYSSNNTAVATVDNSGKITTVSTGTATITATVVAGATWNAASDSYTLTVTEAPSLQVTWSTPNGNLTDANATHLYVTGETLLMPTTTPSCAGRTFVGWTTTADYTSKDAAPSDLFTTAGSKTVTSNVTYYAVFH